MSYSKLAEVVALLADRTSRGLINWSQTEQEGTFQASFPNYSVRLSQEFNQRDDVVDIVAEILNGDGDLVERVSDPQLREQLNDPYRIMSDMYVLARRQALGVDAALDSIISELKNS